jgi:fluoride exporter
MQLELVRMLDASRYGLAAAYAATSLALGYLAVHVASAVVRRVRIVR